MKGIKTKFTAEGKTDIKLSRCTQHGATLSQNLEIWTSIFTSDYLIHPACKLGRGTVDSLRDRPGKHFWKQTYWVILTREGEAHWINVFVFFKVATWAHGVVEYTTLSSLVVTKDSMVSYKHLGTDIHYGRPEPSHTAWCCVTIIWTDLYSQHF